jgi:hypothetical protein
MKIFIKTSLVVLILSTLVSCASYNPGNYADIKSGEHPKNLPINAKTYDQLSESPFTYVNFTFGNKSADTWYRVKRIRVTSIGGIKGARLVVGPDLKFWAQGMERKTKIDAHNRAMVFGAIQGALLVGAAASGASGKHDLALGLVGGSMAYTSIEAFNQAFNEADMKELDALVPEGHLYRPFSIPRNLFITRWAVFETPGKKKAEYIEFEVEYLSGKKVSYKVNI